jgi:hypothetical protein
MSPGGLLSLAPLPATVVGDVEHIAEDVGVVLDGVVVVEVVDDDGAAVPALPPDEQPAGTATAAARTHPTPIVRLMGRP